MMEIVDESNTLALFSLMPPCGFSYIHPELRPSNFQSHRLEHS